MKSFENSIAKTYLKTFPKTTEYSAEFFLITTEDRLFLFQFYYSEKGAYVYFPPQNRSL